jgi:pyruvate ferredoxin oxidoreductase delta subunit
LAKPEHEITWKDLEVGCIVTEPGNASQYQTGDWRSQRPILNKERCIQCGLCYLFCPEPCVKHDEEKYFVADLFYCKSCGICALECPMGAIQMVEEGA